MLCLYRNGQLFESLRNYQPVAWVLYQRVIDQSKADIFIKPGIIVHIVVICILYCYGHIIVITLILLSCCVFIEMVNCLNTIILKSFLIIAFTSILHLFYRTIIPPKLCTRHIFLINRIRDPITSEVMNNVTLARINKMLHYMLNMTINTVGTLNLST
jgi:hypothetical protein